jgi:hypothetical protein
LGEKRPWGTFLNDSIHSILSQKGEEFNFKIKCIILILWKYFSNSIFKIALFNFQKKVFTFWENKDPKELKRMVLYYLNSQLEWMVHY